MTSILSGQLLQWPNIYSKSGFFFWFYLFIIPWIRVELTLLLLCGQVAEGDGETDGVSSRVRGNFYLN